MPFTDIHYSVSKFIGKLLKDVCPECQVLPSLRSNYLPCDYDCPESSTSHGAVTYREVPLRVARRLCGTCEHQKNKFYNLNLK